MEPNELTNISQAGGLPDITFPDITAPAAPAAQTAQAAAIQKIIVGNREFNSSEEALAYANGLAEAQNRASASFSQPAAVDPATQPLKVKLGQLLFEDPEEALRQNKEMAKQEIRAEQKAIDDNRDFWQDFYKTNPDMVGSELLVDAVLQREQAKGSFQLGNGTFMSRQEAAPILVAKARAEVSKIRNIPTGGQALPQGQAMTAGASGDVVPRAAPQAQPKTNFITELNSVRKKG